MAYELKYGLNEDIASLFSGAKGEDDVDTAVKGLENAKKLADALKKASQEEYAAKKALYDKVKGQETNKSVIILAGGDGDAAEETENGKFKIGTLIPKWGGDSGFIAPEEFGDIKKADQVLQDVDQAITDVQTKGGSGGGEENKSSQTLADEFIAGNEGFKVISAEEKDAKVTVNNPETGEDEEMPKYEGAKDFKGKKEDGSDDVVVWVAKEINYSENSSAQVSATNDNVSEEEAVCEKCGEVHEGECATHEAVTESFAFKSGSVADRFRSLM